MGQVFRFFAVSAGLRQTHEARASSKLKKAFADVPARDDA
jgi:hypothetical protein